MPFEVKNLMISLYYLLECHVTKYLNAALAVTFDLNK